MTDLTDDIKEVLDDHDKEAPVVLDDMAGIVAQLGDTMMWTVERITHWVTALHHRVEAQNEEIEALKAERDRYRETFNEVITTLWQHENGEIDDETAIDEITEFCDELETTND